MRRGAATPGHPFIRKADLVIEVLSPDDRLSETLQKIADYRAAGIPHIWLADPYEGTVFTGDEKGIRRAADQLLETELTDQVGFRPLFAELDEPAE